MSIEQSASPNIDPPEDFIERHEIDETFDDEAVARRAKELLQIPGDDLARGVSAEAAEDIGYVDVPDLEAVADERDHGTSDATLTGPALARAENPSMDSTRRSRSIAPPRSDMTGKFIEGRVRVLGTDRYGRRRPA